MSANQPPLTVTPQNAASPQASRKKKPFELGPWADYVVPVIAGIAASYSPNWVGRGIQTGADLFRLMRDLRLQREESAQEQKRLDEALGAQKQKLQLEQQRLADEEARRAEREEQAQEQAAARSSLLRQILSAGSFREAMEAVRSLDPKVEPYLDVISEVYKTAAPYLNYLQDQAEREANARVLEMFGANKFDFQRTLQAAQGNPALQSALVNVMPRITGVAEEMRRQQKAAVPAQPEEEPPDFGKIYSDPMAAFAKNPVAGRIRNAIAFEQMGNHKDAERLYNAILGGRQTTGSPSGIPGMLLEYLAAGLFNHEGVTPAAQEAAKSDVGVDLILNNGARSVLKDGIVYVKFRDGSMLALGPRDEVEKFEIAYRARRAAEAQRPTAREMESRLIERLPDRRR